MILKIGIVLLILIASGTLYLVDYLIKQDQTETTAIMHQALQRSRTEAESRARVKERFESQLLGNFNNCQENALKTYADYVDLIQKAAPKKRGQSIVPNDVLDAAAKVLTDARIECKKTYDSKLLEGP